MIRNQREFNISSVQAQKFRDAIAAAGRDGPPTGVAPKLHQASIEAMRSQLETLERELAEYADLQAPRKRRVLEAPVDALGSLLIQARIARGWTQRELAERLGLQMQKIQQYEATEYAGASVTRVREVLQALAVTAQVRLELLEIPASLEALRAGAPTAATATKRRPAKARA